MSVATGKKRKASTTRTNDPERTKADIIKVATEEFCESGFAGARVDEIAKRTKTSKRMIYYYFESKDGLYRAVLAAYFQRFRNSTYFQVDESGPTLEVIAQVVRGVFDFHIDHAEDTRLLMVENIHRGKHMDVMPNRTSDAGAFGLIRRLLARGVEEGVVRPDVSPGDVYTDVAALSFFNVSNRYTFAEVHGLDVFSPEVIKMRRDALVDLVIRYVKA